MRRLTPLVVFCATLATAVTSTVQSVRGAVATAVSAVRELNAREQAVHVLNRLAFGPRPDDVERVMKAGVDRWVDQQLHPERIQDRETEKLLSSYESIHKSPDELIRAYPPPQLIRAQLRGAGMTRRDSMELRRQQQQNRAFVGEIVSARVARAVASERQLQEVMTDFWLNHFTVFIGKGQQIRYFIPDYERERIRPHALGHFRELLGAVATSPAMLFYLDNAQSVADSGQPVLSVAMRRRPGGGPAMDPRRRPGFPGGGRRLPPQIRERAAAGDTDGLRARGRELMQQIQQRRPRGINENYARELLELHTLGVDGGYTQKDVIEVARALTGWTIRPPRTGGSGFLFRPETHDAGEKVVLGHRLRAGRGIEDGEEVLDIVARHPSTARYIARKLAIRLVSDAPPQALVDRAAAAFTRTDGDIREVVRTIITSNEFFARAAFHSKVKSPFEVTVSALRALGARPDTSPRTAAVVAYLGQPIFGHQAPNGWPETGEAWMNTGAILNRINFGLAVAAGRVPGASLHAWSHYDDLVRKPRAEQVDGIVEALLGGRASEETREILSSGTSPLLGKAAADSIDMFGDTVGRDDETMGPGAGSGPLRRPLRPGQAIRNGGFNQLPQLTGLAQIVGLALGSPEFQRR